MARDRVHRGGGGVWLRADCRGVFDKSWVRRVLADVGVTLLLVVATVVLLASILPQESR